MNDRDPKRERESRIDRHGEPKHPAAASGGAPDDEGHAILRDQLLDLVAGELDENHTIRLEQHLGECSGCRREARELRALLAKAGETREWLPSPSLQTHLLGEMRRMRKAGAQENAEDRNRVAPRARTSTSRDLPGALGTLFRFRLRPSFAGTLAALVLAVAAGFWLGRTLPSADSALDGFRPNSLPSVETPAATPPPSTPAGVESGRTELAGLSRMELRAAGSPGFVSVSTDAIPLFPPAFGDSF